MLNLYFQRQITSKSTNVIFLCNVKRIFFFFIHQTYVLKRRVSIYFEFVFRKRFPMWTSYDFILLIGDLYHVTTFNRSQFKLIINTQFLYYFIINYRL